MINDGGNRIHLWNMWKRNFKSAQVYRQHKAGGLHIVIEITQNASLRLICHTPYEQCLDQWQHQYRQHIPTVDSFSPECDIMFPKVVGSLRVSEVLWVSGVLWVSESQNHELYYSRRSSRRSSSSRSRRRRSRRSRRSSRRRRSSSAVACSAVEQ